MDKYLYISQAGPVGQLENFLSPPSEPDSHTPLLYTVQREDGESSKHLPSSADSIK